MMEAACDTIRRWKGYAPTPLYSLAVCAEHYQVGSLMYKDEGPRFGLDSFKALGGAYAIECLLARQALSDQGRADFTVATATDGNHGRSVAWGAQRAGCRAKIFVHRHVSEQRIAAIARYGAEVIRVDGNYDDSVHACSEQAAQHNWHIVSDTSWPGYTDTPRQVMAGYTVIMREIMQQADGEPFTHLILPAGVGALAAAISAAFVQYNNYLPRIIIVESEHCDCLRQSIAADRVISLNIGKETIMAGLSCGEPSLLAWEILSAVASDFVAISDDSIAAMMRLLAKNGIVGGECAVAGLALLTAAATDHHWCNALDLTADSHILLLGSEGASDAGQYHYLTGQYPDTVV